MGFQSSGRSHVLLSTSCAIPFAIVASMLLSSSLVGAVDILLSNTFNCGGTCLACLNTPSRECCLPAVGAGPAPSVAIRNAEIPDVSATSRIYHSNGCQGSNPVQEQGNKCQTGLFPQFTGAYWFILPPPLEPAPSPSRRLLSVDTSETTGFVGDTDEGVFKTVYTDSVFFTEQGMEGHWVLLVSNFTEYFSRMQRLWFGSSLKVLFTAHETECELLDSSDPQ